MSKVVIAGLASLFILQGCVISVNDDDFERGSHYHNEQKREKKNRDYISDLAIGTNEHSVKGALGTPDFNELLVKNEQQYKILYYRTQRTHSDGKTTKDECTPLLFKNGELVGYGDTALSGLQ
ncbi:DUF3192 domain-containing protein [Agaribacter flavus]|uniref:DUF3192 domain-containing protein n=1 Tax=Agaribacter flavus TaxID=1902781 RepID=A0ABV7FPA6_9ALTE